jgi:hypothetical protein
MSEYAAQLVENVVQEIIVGSHVWAKENLGGQWVDCADNGELIAGIGYTYDVELHEFVAPVITE